MKENLKEVYTQRTDSCDMANSVEFTALMNKYKCAIMEVETKLNVLDAEFSLNYDRNPFESIETRLKSPASIMEKLKRKGFEPTLENIEKNLFDVAGVRVVCAFQEDIYKLAELLTGQDDIRLLRTKDYIQHPKENGYRSLHLILEVPIFLADGKEYMKVEVQFRTIAMDFWASLEHKIYYKFEGNAPDYISRDLRECAKMVSELDEKMLSLNEAIQACIVQEDNRDSMDEVLENVIGNRKENKLPHLEAAGG